MARLIVLLLSVLLGGCVSRGTLDFNCRHFDTEMNQARPFRTELPNSQLEAAIRGQTFTPEQSAQLDQVRRAEAQQLLQSVRSTNDQPPRPVVALLLSGGGQWGAFGAGFMSRLVETGRFPDVKLVTGVSTGGLQALFVGAGLNNRLPDQNLRAWAVRDVDGEGDTYARLMRYEYRPNRESEIVNRNAEALSIVTGSMAGLRPLRRVIEEALCPDPDGAGHCMIDDLARSDILTLIGFVDAQDGKFYYVNVNRIARSMDRFRSDPAARIGPDEPPDPPLTRRAARECVTAAALASVAMPAFFQQVRINERTYFDGGVRRSVFADYAAQVAWIASKEAAQAPAPGSGAGNPGLVIDPTVFVLRNGPTAVLVDPEAGQRRMVIDSALRAERIVVNELEVGSVAGLRLDIPFGQLFFRSADSWERFPYRDAALGEVDCDTRKGDREMFDPDFMRCIMAFGADAANQTESWRPLPGLKLPETSIKPDVVAPPAGDTQSNRPVPADAGAVKPPA